MVARSIYRTSTLQALLPDVLSVAPTVGQDKASTWPCLQILIEKKNEIVVEIWFEAASAKLCKMAGEKLLGN